MIELFSSHISGDEGPEFRQLLDDAGIYAVQAWINAGNTKTTGLDFVLNWKSNDRLTLVNW